MAYFPDPDSHERPTDSQNPRTNPDLAGFEMGPRRGPHLRTPQPIMLAGSPLPAPRQNGSAPTAAPNSPPVPSSTNAPAGGPLRAIDALPGEACPCGPALEGIRGTVDQIHSVLLTINDTAKAIRDKPNIAEAAKPKTPKQAPKGGALQKIPGIAAMAGNIGSNIVQNRSAAALTQVGHGAASMIGAIAGPAGLVVGAFVGVAAAGAKLTEALLHRGEELAKFSAPLSQAVAQRDAKRMQADMREAQALGPDLARLMEASTNLEIELRDQIWVPIKKALIEVLIPIVENLKDLIIGIANGIEIVYQTLKTSLHTMRDLFTGQWSKIDGEWRKLDEKISEIVKNTKKTDLKGGLFGDLIKNTHANWRNQTIGVGVGTIDPRIQPGINVPAAMGL